MSNIVYVCLEDNCPETNCKNHRTNTYTGLGRQYGYFRNTSICPICVEERKEKENEENILLQYRSADNNRNSDSLHILREEEKPGYRNSRKSDGDSCTICEYNCCE